MSECLTLYPPISHSFACLLGDFSGLCICLYRSLWSEPLYSWLFLCASCPYVLLYVFLSVYVCLYVTLYVSRFVHVCSLCLPVFLPSFFLPFLFSVYLLLSITVSLVLSVCLHDLPSGPVFPFISLWLCLTYCLSLHMSIFLYDSVGSHIVLRCVSPPLCLWVSLCLS